MSESLPSESGFCSSDSIFKSIRLDESLLNTSHARSLYFKDRFVYTQRTLSFEADILNAFSGLLNRQDFFHIWGQTVTIFGSNLPACTDFAMSSLWSSWKEIMKSSVIAYRTKEAASIRRSGFPSWSWSSVDGTIVSDEGSEIGHHYEQFVNGSTNFESRPPLTTHFYLPEREGEPCVDLCDAQSLYQTTGFKNVNFDKLVVEGEVVKVRLIRDSYVYDRIRSYRCCDKEGILIPDPWEYKYSRYDSMVYHRAALDLPETNLEPHSFMKLNDEAIPFEDLDTIAQEFQGKHIQDISRWSISKEIDEALVLIDWRTDTSEGRTRWVLMLLKWLDDNTAESVAILGRYGLDAKHSIHRQDSPREEALHTCVGGFSAPAARKEYCG